MKLLLVDDDSFLRDMYATKFSELNHIVDVAETGEAALAKLRENTYDVALIDMIMPGKSGVELVKQIKREELGGNPICIMLSNQSEEADKNDALQSGAAGYIVKAERIPSEVIQEVVALASNK